MTRAPSQNGHPSSPNGHSLSGHALRNHHLCQRSLARAAGAPPLARTAVAIRAATLDMTRLEFARRSGIGRGTLRDFELGVHRPTRHTLQRFIAFCQRRAVSQVQLEELLTLYTGPADSLEQFIARLELRAGSARDLARRVGISPSTLWEYRRGNFPLPWSLLKKLCQAVGEDPSQAEPLWQAAERKRLVDRGYPQAWAELCVWCARAGRAESHLLKLGVTTAALRRLQYLELPEWNDVAPGAQALARNADECRELKRQWTHDWDEQRRRPRDDFGDHVKRLREARGMSRRELADLFGIGGKKPARIIKYVEEDGYYSLQAYPAGLTAVLAGDGAVEHRLLELWQLRRRQFTRRRRPETRTDLRLTREWYGFDFCEVKPILGYSSLEYQKIERGIEPLADAARQRIEQAFHEAGRQRVAALLERLSARRREREAWRSPPTVTALVGLLARRERGLVPLARRLSRAGLERISAPRLRAIARGGDVPAWRLLEQIAGACDVADLTAARQDWERRYRSRLEKEGLSPLGIEVRLLIAETAATVREFSRRLPFNYSVLTRDLIRVDHERPLKWFHVERILTAAGVRTSSERWQEIRVLWCTMEARRGKG